MMQKSFFGLFKPRFEYELFMDALPDIRSISVPKRVSLFLKGAVDHKQTPQLKIGDEVKKGQRLNLVEGDNSGVVATVSGKIVSLSPFMGDYGAKWTIVTIEASNKQEVDESFANEKEPNLEVLSSYLSSAPGAPAIDILSNEDKPVDTLVIYGGDTDVLVCTNQVAIKNGMADVKRGIEILKKVTGIKEVIIAIAGESMQGYGDIGAVIKRVPREYPYASPMMVMHNVLGRSITDGRSFEDHGVCFMRAEAVVSIGKAFNEKVLPTKKMVCLVDKAGKKSMLMTTIGTPIKSILRSYNIEVQDKDRIIIGGPMTGTAIYSEDYPIRPDTDAIIIQDKEDIPMTSDYPCINCGDCIPTCPANIQISMLVRLLEAGQYEDAADLYDLNSCVECGICSFVCVSRIPILQYIKLAKHELSRMMIAEETNE